MTQKSEERSLWILAIEGAPATSSRACPDELIGLTNPLTGNSICHSCASRILDRGPTLLGSKLKPVWLGSGLLINCVTCNVVGRSARR